MSVEVPDSDAPEIQFRRACEELGRRLRAGEPGRAEDLLTTYPALASDDERACELIYKEFVIREELGQQPSPDEWYERFPQWRAQLEELFPIHDLIRDSVASGFPSAPFQESSEVSGRRLGHYELLEELGRGGMGVVYKARDLKLQRVVALKIIRDGAYAEPRDVSRFRNEAQAVAQLQHPNIVQLYEVGEAEGQAYFTMELVQGATLTQWLSGKLPVHRKVAELIESLARAMHYAHQQGIVHRDLKPANVLLSGDGVPKITDFGLAKRLTSVDGHSGTIVGTLSYMAPEQARGGDQRQIGPAIDIYALGAILYELLTGRPPFGNDVSLETLQQVSSEEPVAPSRLQPRLSHDLETICLKCLQKEPRKRYADAAALADDLRHFLAGEPIVARPVAAWEREWKWVKRHPALTALIAVSVAALLAVGIGSLWYNAQLERALTRAEQSQGETQEQAGLLRQQLDYSRRTIYALQLSHVESLWERDPLRGLELLQDESRCPQDVRDFTWDLLHRLCKRYRVGFNEGTGIVSGVAYSPDGSLLATSSWKQIARRQNRGAVKLWDAVSGRHRATLVDGDSPFFCVVFSPDGKSLAAATVDRSEDGPSKVILWDTKTLMELATFAGHRQRIKTVAFSPDGRLLASGSDDATVKLWDLATGQELDTLKGSAAPIHSVAFSADGRLLAAGAGPPGPHFGEVHLWETATRRALAALQDPMGSAVAVAFSPDGKTLAAGSADASVRLWDCATFQLRTILREHSDTIYALAFSPDSQTLLSTSRDSTLKLWDLSSGRSIASFKGHVRQALAVAFAPVGNAFVSGGADQTVRVWDIRPSLPRVVWHERGKKPLCVKFAPDGKTLVAGFDAASPSVRAWETALWQERSRLEGHTKGVAALAFAADGETLATGSHDGSVLLWDARRLVPRQTLPRHDDVACVAFDPRGKMVAVGYAQKLAHILDVATGQRLATLELKPGVLALTFSAAGDTLVTCGRDGAIKLWDTTTWKERAPLAGHAGAVTTVVFAPDGRTLVTGGEDRTVRIWDLATLKEKLTLEGHTHWVYSSAFSPNGRTLATGTGRTDTRVPGEVKLWDPETGHLRATLQGQVGPITFGPDGKSLITASLDGALNLWDVRDR